MIATTDLQKLAAYINARGGTAFPAQASVGATTEKWMGMSMRDYFAGQALPAVIAATSAGQHSPKMRDSETHIRDAISRDAYAMADAMLKVSAETAKPDRALADIDDLPEFDGQNR